jgi:peptide/nickel transport system ATP-binding protein
VPDTMARSAAKAPAPKRSNTILSIEALSVSFPAARDWINVVNDVTLDVHRGETLGLVGESGSGKTVTSMAVMGLVPALGGRLTDGRIRFDDADITALPEREWLGIRGRRIAMIFQQPTRSLDPAFTVGDQIAEAVRAHLKLSRRRAWDRAVSFLDRVHIPKAAERAHDYPHMFSGGMCQRVMIAMALACEPELLIADEPTTALDVTVQSKVLDLLHELKAELNLTVVYISHDLGVVAEICDRVAVMYCGQIVEVSPIADLFERPRHPYTQGLLDSIPRPGGGKRTRAIPGHVPPPTDLPQGCRFHPRCPHVDAPLCLRSEPTLVELNGVHQARCHRADVLDLPGINR